VISGEEDVYGRAALSICESLLLSLNDNKVLAEKEIVGILRDAALTHRQATGEAAETGGSSGAADLIDKIISGGNSVRR
jgi:hypothetical protein